MNIGHKLKNLLKLRQMSQQELAEQSGVSLAMVKALANDKRDNTTIQTLNRLSNALGVSTTYLLEKDADHPWQFLNHIPLELQSFVLDPANQQFLEVAHLAAQRRLSPTALAKLITCLAEVLEAESKV